MGGGTGIGTWHCIGIFARGTPSTSFSCSLLVLAVVKQSSFIILLIQNSHSNYTYVDFIQFCLNIA